MVAPEFTPSYLSDKKRLSEAANAVEASETRVNSHVANHWDQALWRNGTAEEQMAIAAEVARRLSDRYGVWVLYGVHKPTDHGNDGNWHAHYEHNMREVGFDGFGAKVRRIVDKKTRSEETVWVRKMMAEVMNDYLAMKNSDERVSHLSYKDQGVDKEPTRHLGNKRNMLELDGIQTNVGDWNRGVRERNSEAEAEDKQHDAAIARAEENLAEINKRKKVMSDSADPASREFYARQQRQMDENIKATQDKLSPEQLEIGRRFYQQMDIAAKDGERLRKEELAGRTKETDITDAAERFAKAAAERFDIRRPEASLSETVGVEGARAKAEHTDLTRKAAEQKDGDLKRDILLRRDIMHADYMAITSQRLAGISNYVGGANRRIELDEQGKPIPMQTEAERYKGQADHWQEQGTKLRAERAKLDELRMKKAMDHAVNRKDAEDLSRMAGFDPNHMDPGRYRPVDHHHERVKGMGEGGRQERKEETQPSASRQPSDDRPEMVRAMQEERRQNDPHHEVTDRAPVRELTDKEQARQNARENFARVMNESSRERDEVGGRTSSAEKSRGGRSL
jgi:hypothetical protein